MKDSNKELGAGLNEWRGGAGIRERERERVRRYRRRIIPDLCSYNKCLKNNDNGNNDDNRMTMATVTMTRSTMLTTTTTMTTTMTAVYGSDDSDYNNYRTPIKMKTMSLL